MEKSEEIIKQKFDKAIKFAENNNYDKVIEILEKIDLEKVENDNLKALILLGLSFNYLKKQKFDKAIENLKNINFKNINIAKALIYYLECISYMKKNEKSEFDKNLKLLLGEMRTNEDKSYIPGIILYSDTKIEFIKEIFSQIKDKKDILKEIFTLPKVMKYLEYIGNKEILDNFNDLEILADDFKSTQDSGIFYKYRDVNIYTINSLIEKGIYKSNPRNFNDPFDPIFKIDNLNSEILKEKLKDIKIVSLSKNCDNYLMWSHYANSHKGICLGYEIDKNKIDKNLAFCKVDYEDLKCNDINLLNFSNYNGDLGLKLGDVFLRKYKDWEYEKEYRFICLKNDGKDYLTDAIELKEVIFGYQISENDKAHIIEIIKKFYDIKKIKFKKIIFKLDEFKIDIIKDEEI